MNRKLVFLLFLIFTSIFIALYAVATTAAPPQPTPPVNEEQVKLIKNAVKVAIDGEREFVLGYLVNDVQVSNVQISQDETWGVIYLEMVDPQTGELLPSEPGLAFARWTGTEWEITLPSDPGWIDLVKSAPQELLTDEYKVSYEEMYRTEILTSQATYSGYLLPWEAGKTVYLSQSTGHDQYIKSGSGHYAFDFYIHKTMYKLRASKAGTVWRTRWDVPNGDDSDMGNYIVLKDTATSPTTYQLYLHLAQDSIPTELRTQGVYVPQGQFIGIADDTGQSTGHHLHFHVHTNPNSYWGTSVDITFEDVDINGGRPRRESDLPYCTRPGDVCNKFRNAYVSQNGDPVDTNPPTGDLFEPVTGSVVTSPSIHVEGWSFDEDSGFNNTQLIAYFDEAWHDVGPVMTDMAFSADWDMCADQVPNGPVSLALRIQDNEGNYSQGLPGLTHVIKNFDCTTVNPACTPGPDQIGIYSDSDYRGQCQIFNSGSYTELSTWKNTIESIQIGSNVQAQLFSESNFLGRSETVILDESDLEDNPIGGNQITSLKVLSRTDPPDSPVTLLSPGSGDQIPARSSLSFSWRDAGGGTQFQVSLSGPGGDIPSEWLSTANWQLPGTDLVEGLYSWKVRARNCPDAPCVSNWSNSSTFSIIPPLPDILSTSAPFVDDLESGAGNWHASGPWNLLQDADRSHSSDHSWYYGSPSNLNYDTGGANYGDLTSRPISIPDNDYVLRFWYRYDTEENWVNWDQRWVQISADGAPFENILQLKDDKENYWLQKTLDLSGYSGQNIQIRFHFATLDELENNTHEGWLIDDVEVVQEVLPGCLDTDDTPAGANPIDFGQTLSHKICPTGDIDYFKFDGQAGDHIVLDIDTPHNNPVEFLDLYLFLLDNDGKSVISKHDDEILGIEFDPHLGYQLGRTGTYYVRTRLWSHPTHGGGDFTYDLTLTKDNTPPQAIFVSPASGSYLADDQNFTLSVNAIDQNSGISQVEFLYHSGDWLNSNWQVIGTDLDGSDGWEISIDTTNLPEQKDAAFFANVYDWAGNWTGVGAWELGIDRNSPLSEMSTLDPIQQSTAIHLEWSGTDNLSGIDFYDLQSQTDNSSWSAINPNPTNSETERWFIGQPGSQYSFRIRAVDQAGNQEPFPSNTDTSTEIPAASTICSNPDQWDSSSNDNSPATATLIDLTESGQIHNFCNPSTGDRLYDEDWVKFDAVSGDKYLIESNPLSEVTGTILELYAADGTTLISSSQSKDYDEKVRIIWTSDRNGLIYLRTRHLDGAIAGNIVSYKLKVNKFLPIFLPFIH
ncbi:MAG: peptidoglycan DD-metalloendopeptidase family protein [Chloroflexota bacterium]|nr:MAG: peptidoglycan DD-metalloendopeptidase family protein [Chloroflexota bacterium]